MRFAQLPDSFFTANRSRLAAKLPAQSLAVLNSNDVMPTNADGTMGFCQNSDLYYLTGVDQEDTILILCPDSSDPERREVLFVRETNDYIAVWEGARLTREQASAVSGIESVFWLGDFERVFKEMMDGVDEVYLNANEHLRAQTVVQTRDARFREKLVSQYPLHSLKRLAPLLYRLRMIKTTEEIEAELLHQYTRGQSRGFSYPPIIATGKNACVLHYIENNANCQDGELVLLDVAAEYSYYRSDMTRTIPINGKFSPRQREVYDAVLRVLRACNDLLRRGVLLADYQKEAEKLMEAEIIGLGLLDAAEVVGQDPEKPLFKKYFMHGMSHHIGLDVHDVHDKSVPLEVNMVLTIEPGIYIREEGLAVRLENIVVIGSDGNEDLMQDVPIEADDIEASMNWQ